MNDIERELIQTNNLKDKIRELENRLQSGREYLVGLDNNKISVEDALEAFGFARNGQARTQQQQKELIQKISLALYEYKLILITKEKPHPPTIEDAEKEYINDPFFHRIVDALVYK